MEVGQPEKAIEVLEKGIRANPNSISLMTELGNRYRDQMRCLDAVRCYQRSIDLDPKCAGPHYNLGNALSDQGNFQGAISAYRKAVNLEPDFAEAYNNMGNAFYAQGEFQKAIRCYEKALDMRSDYTDALKNMGLSFEKQGLIRQAIDCYNLTLKIDPKDAECHSGLLFAMQYDASLDRQKMYSESLTWWRMHGEGYANRFRHRIGVDPSKRLKVGYVSPDFRTHSVSYFFQSLLENHNSEMVETFCYSDVRKPDPMTSLLRGLAHHWRSVLGKSDEMVARSIFEDQIDILVDLSGHTSNNRLLVFAQKPAPIQITWLGYPDTTGMPVMDYRLTDDVADPEGKADDYNTEQLIRLPYGFLCYTPPDVEAGISGLPALERGTVTFGSFNNLPKINEAVVEMWAAVLREVPKSALMLKSKSLGNTEIQRRYLKLFEACGVSSDRIILEAYTKTIEEHLSLYNRVDIGLDPFPYNGTTTTCEALWMGVPVVTLKGNRHSSRVGASILTSVGLKDLISDTQEEYVMKAKGLSDDLATLERLRMNMRDRMKRSPLCDAGAFARKMETMYREVWKQHCTKTDYTDSLSPAATEAMPTA